MLTVSKNAKPIGYVEKFVGNKPDERWVAFLPREAGDNGTFPARRQGFPTRRAAVLWIEANDTETP